MKYQSKNVVISEVIDNDLYIVQAKDKVTAARMGKRELVYLLELLSIPLESVGIEIKELATFPALTNSDKEALFNRFKLLGFIKSENDDSASKKRKFNDIIKNIRAIKLFSINIDPVLNKLNPLIKILYCKSAVVFSLTLLLMGILALMMVSPGMAELSAKNLLLEVNWPILALMQLTTMFIHELSHGMVCKYYGGIVPEIGIMLYYLIPVPYCNTNDVYTFSLKSQKVKVALAGIYSNFIFSGIGLLIYSIFLYNNTNVTILLVYSSLNIGVSVINLIPFVKYDGYWALSALLNMTNMIDKSFTLFLSLFISPRYYRKVDLNIGKKIALTTFGFISSIFDLLFWYISVGYLKELLYPFLNNFIYVLLGLLIALILKSVINRWYHEINDIIKTRDKVLLIKFY